ncbi:YihY/virulence factor BrkB family protein [Paraburkholderia sprentiae WSM5005]|uniref:YihY/virulence factor BrkB family protein n=1 Tax=Paraburkholderia sprentiae WSM5005 TaxID=754502 RepID=A0A1I9YRL0_9BURK|nr:YihY/virulence factor BrkB family protein [Paraburkholderia sprentiae]APA88847.1 YihY/virulence factor BrkB family protein [Paraburkholderia sprentiae WSM5005]
MPILLDQHALNVVKHPGRFLLQTLKAFRANQGLLLAGAVAYYALLSIVPLLILIVIVLSRVVPQQLVLDALAHLLRWLVPGQSAALVRELSNFLLHRAVIGWVLLLTMIFFSSLAFTVLENAMSLIFVHRVVVKRRHFLISALLPYCYILFLGVGLLIVTFVSSALDAIGAEGLKLFGLHVSLQGFSRVVLYLFGLAGEIFVLTSVYLVMPVGRPSIKHALIGGVVAGGLWEITRHVLVWYFATLSQVSVVYGSLTMAIVILLSFEWLATLLLFGAQVISQYERFGHESLEAPQPEIKTG